MINRNTAICKCIACNAVVAGTGEYDAVTVVADIAAGYCVIAGTVEDDAINIVVADIVTCYCVVVGI